MSFRHPFVKQAQVLGLIAGVGFGTVNQPILNAFASTTANRYQVTSEQSKVHPLFRKTILLDAGHGGPDSGARGDKEIQEKHITLSVTMRLVRYLQEAGAVVITTRNMDKDLATDSDRVNRRRHLGDLRGRWKVAQRQPIDAMVSIHCNAASSPSWRGAETLYYDGNEEGEKLAHLMQQSFSSNVLPTRRSIQSNRNLYLLKRVEGPTVLAEIGFITNPEEAHYLQTGKYQDRVALAMYVALTKYFAELT